MTTSQFTAAQSESTAESIAFGQTVAGQITNTTPDHTYQFEALRCDFIRIDLEITSGNLDPIITILDATGHNIFNRDDTGGRLDITYEPLSLPQNGQYTVVVGRFGYGLGTTTGNYELRIERIGNGSNNYCGLRYGDYVYNSIDNMEPALFYFFRARQGDIIDVSMERRSGDLDPHLRIVDNDSVVLAHNDDFPGTGTNARIAGFLIPEDGTYYIIASRYGVAAGDSTGTFMLSLEEAQNSGLGNSLLAPIPIQPGAVVQGQLTGQNYQKYYRFRAEENDLITVGMDRTGSERLDAYLVIADANLSELSADDDSGGGQNALIRDFLIPATGTYYIIATRFERELGTTAGTYQLRLESGGNIFEDVPADINLIEYGESIAGIIDSVSPSVRYAFRGVVGDTITVSMNQSSGDLDPYINILAENGSVLASDDDSGGRPNARIARYVIPQTGIYYIEVTRYNGEDNPNTSGGYVLVLAQRFD